MDSGLAYGVAELTPAEESIRLEARARLTFLLQLAYSGELAATRAYLGHRGSLRSSLERAEVGRIIRDELRHRRCVLGMLNELGAEPDARRERKMERVGRSISLFCLIGGWFFPMYGAGRLEAQNIKEYELAARLALLAGLQGWVDPLLEMAEVEWDHERYFRCKAASHLFWKAMPKWPQPPPREEIRASFNRFHGLEPATRALPELRVPRWVR